MTNLTSSPSYARKPLAFLLPLLLSPMLLAAPVPAPLRAEVDALLSVLQSSACEFNRNDSWYAAPEAKAHLLRKFEYLEGKNAVQTTEQFIELGASKSSISGQPYMVKCGNAAPVESKSWLAAQLKVIRTPARVSSRSAN